MLSLLCSQSIYKITQAISSEDFIHRHRHKAVDFTRRSIFTFERVAGVLLITLMRSLLVELDQFFAYVSITGWRSGRHIDWLVVQFEQLLAVKYAERM